MSNDQIGTFFKDIGAIGIGNLERFGPKDLCATISAQVVVPKDSDFEKLIAGRSAESYLQAMQSRVKGATDTCTEIRLEVVDRNGVRGKELKRQQDAEALVERFEALVGGAVLQEDCTLETLRLKRAAFYAAASDSERLETLRQLQKLNEQSKVRQFVRKEQIASAWEPLEPSHELDGGSQDRKVLDPLDQLPVNAACPGQV